MKIHATLPVKGRDLRLDLFRGVANWGIFLDHIPNNVVNWVTTRNYGFSDAADLFIFISGYTVALVFARIMLERGFIIGASRLLKRVWQPAFDCGPKDPPSQSRPIARQQANDEKREHNKVQQTIRREVGFGVRIQGAVDPRWNH